MMCFPDGTDGKEPACQCRWPKRYRFDPWQPTPVSWPGESHGQKSLTGYSPQTRRECYIIRLFIWITLVFSKLLTKVILGATQNGQYLPRFWRLGKHLVQHFYRTENRRWGKLVQDTQGFPSYQNRPFSTGFSVWCLRLILYFQSSI